MRAPMFSLPANAPHSVHPLSLTPRYVEKRMLEEHISKLNDEIAQRDRLDSEIEACVCGMFERLRTAEERAERLAAKLQAAGVALDPEDEAGPPAQ